MISSSTVFTNELLLDTGANLNVYFQKEENYIKHSYLVLVMLYKNTISVSFNTVF
jgi:hypothetical protein